MRAKRAAWFAGAGMAALALGLVAVPSAPGGAGQLVAPQAYAQDELSFRVVSGEVMNDSDAPVPSAIVFLKNLKTKSIRSYTSASDGTYEFVQVNMAVDYELWAEKDGKKSAVKTVSTWDTRKKFVANLKLK